MNPQTLLFYLSPKSAYRDVLISEKEVFCSPDEVDRQRPDGAFDAIRTPLGAFDIKEILDRLPASQQPELLVVKLDATGRMTPRGLSALRCPKVLILGDTHHLRNPIRYLLAYAESETFDVIISDHDRHHLHWFRRQGFSNVHWIPALNYRLDTRPVAPAIHADALFIGQLGSHHIFRQRLFSALRDRGVPFSSGLVPPDQTANHYAQHAVSLNCSLNGDLNLRVFEILGSGGLLLTDRLSADSGLYSLFRVGEDFDDYGSLDELCAKVRRYLDAPEVAIAMREQGQARLLSEHHPDRKRQQLFDLVFGGGESSELRLGDARFFQLAALPKSQIDRDVELYQRIQDAHRISARLLVYAEPSVREELAFLKDLPRLAWADLDQLERDADESSDLDLPQRRVLALASGAGLERVTTLVERFSGDLILCLTKAPSDAAVSEALGRFGYQRESLDSAVFRLRQPLLAALRWRGLNRTQSLRDLLGIVDSSELSREELLGLGQLAIELEQLAFAAKLLEAAAQADRSDVDCLAVLSAIERARGRDRAALEWMTEVIALGPADADRDASALELRAAIPDSAYDVSEYLSPMRRELSGMSQVCAAICFLIPASLADAVEFAPHLDLARFLARRGHNVMLAWRASDCVAWRRCGLDAVGRTELSEIFSASFSEWTLLSRGWALVDFGGRAESEAEDWAFASKNALFFARSEVGVPLARFFRKLVPARDKLRVAVAVRDAGAPIEPLIRAARKLADAHIEIELMLAIEDPNGSAANAALRVIETCGLDERTQAWALDREHAFPSVLARANVYFAASLSLQDIHYEVLAAQASGLTALVPRNGPIAAGLRDGKNCLFCSVNDEREIARSLAALIVNQPVWAEIAEGGRLYAAGQSIAKAGRELEKTILENAAKPREC